MKLPQNTRPKRLVCLRISENEVRLIDKAWTLAGPPFTGLPFAVGQYLALLGFDVPFLAPVTPDSAAIRLMGLYDILLDGYDHASTTTRHGWCFRHSACHPTAYPLCSAILGVSSVLPSLNATTDATRPIAFLP